MKYCLAAALFICVTAQAAQVWESPQAWKDLRRKMTESQVDDLLGSPKEIETVGQNRVWYYQDVPKQKDGQVIWRPKTAFVHFKQVSMNGQEILLLVGWKPPVFKEVQPTPQPAEDKILPDNPLAQLEQIEKVYMEQLQLIDSESSGSPAPNPAQPSPRQQSPGPPAGPGLSLSELFNKLPRQWVLIGIGGSCFVTALAILWPSGRKRKRKLY
jgi:outer membrane protein assembly factor BamE (lipoprotein component of BamABCDE complex)